MSSIIRLFSKTNKYVIIYFCLIAVEKNMHSFHIIIRAFFNICLLKIGPQDLPKSNVFMMLTLIAYIIINTISELLSYHIAQSFLLALIHVGILVFLISSLLYINQYPQRITQTITALVGADILLNLLALPIGFWLIQAEQYGFDMGLPSILLLFLSAWTVTIYAHILSNALDVHFFVAIIIVFIYVMVTFSILTRFFPIPT